jgi:hypothetical protein
MTKNFVLTLIMLGSFVVLIGLVCGQQELFVPLLRTLAN